MDNLILFIPIICIFGLVSVSVATKKIPPDTNEMSLRRQAEAVLWLNHLLLFIYFAISFVNHPLDGTYFEGRIFRFTIAVFYLGFQLIFLALLQRNVQKYIILSNIFYVGLLMSLSSFVLLSAFSWKLMLAGDRDLEEAILKVQLWIFCALYMVSGLSCVVLLIRTRFRQNDKVRDLEPVSRGRRLKSLWAATGLLLTIGGLAIYQISEPRLTPGAYTAPLANYQMGRFIVPVPETWDLVEWKTRMSWPEMEYSEVVETRFTDSGHGDEEFEQAFKDEMENIQPKGRTNPSSAEDLSILFRQPARLISRYDAATYFAGERPLVFILLVKFPDGYLTLVPRLQNEATILTRRVKPPYSFWIKESSDKERYALESKKIFLARSREFLTLYQWMGADTLSDSTEFKTRYGLINPGLEPTVLYSKIAFAHNWVASNAVHLSSPPLRLVLNIIVGSGAPNKDRFYLEADTSLVHKISDCEIDPHKALRKIYNRSQKMAAGSCGVQIIQGQWPTSSSRKGRLRLAWYDDASQPTLMLQVWGEIAFDSASSKGAEIMGIGEAVINGTRSYSSIVLER